MILRASERRGPVCAGLGSLVLTMLVVAGCAKSDGRSATVSGKVALNGVPVSAGTILLISDDGRASSAELQPDGSYHLRCFPGEFKVAVSPPAPPDPMGGGSGAAPQSAVEIPAKYHDFGSSGLTTRVKDGDNTFDISLTP